MAPTRAVCTALIGRYEPLSEQPVAAASGLPFLCFTDDPSLTSTCWEIHVVDPALPRDPVRSARRIKALLHEYAVDCAETLYIDNAVTLRTAPEEILDAALSQHDLALVRHTSREHVVDEFEVVADDGLDDPSRVYEQLLHYRATWPEILDERPFAAGVIARRHTGTVDATMRTWYDHQLRYSRRDQLSLNLALALHGLEHTVLELDDADNPWFSAGSPPGRRGERRTGAYRTALRPPADVVRAAERRAEEEFLRRIEAETALAGAIERLGEVQVAVEEARGERDAAQDEMSRMRSTISWRLTAPIRRIRRS